MNAFTVTCPAEVELPMYTEQFSLNLGNGSCSEWPNPNTDDCLDSCLGKVGGGVAKLRADWSVTRASRDRPPQTVRHSDICPRTVATVSLCA